MKKKLFFALAFLLFCLSSFGQQSLIQNIASRNNLSLNGRWNYIIDPYENGFYDYRREAYDESKSKTGGYYDDKRNVDKSELIEFNFDKAPTLKVPGNWNSQEEKLSFYEGTVWYRKLFNAKPLRGKRYILYFAAANYESHVYLNGKKLGMHKGGFTPFQFEVTSLLKAGENSVVVKADNTRKKEEIPTNSTDWWNYGGITRDVLLAELPETYIHDYQVQLAKSYSSTIEGFIQLNGATKAQEVMINIPELALTFAVNTDDKGYAMIKQPVNNLTYWSPVNPKLYQVKITSGIDEVNDKIGFRTIETKGKDILLNGKSVFLRGISLHDENPLILGRPRSEGDLKMLLTWAKELNCNFVRLAHYPHNEEMVRLADEMGLLVWGEAPVYWTIARENPNTYNNAQSQLSDLIAISPSWKNSKKVIFFTNGSCPSV
ncbi:MAG: hypothetical protein H7096_01305 [Flavobacterium sp.]|nr:hypothetical protein [Pedobacter sp.]